MPASTAHPTPSQDTTPHVCVIGLGYIGLPTSAILASHGMHVTGVDVVASVVDTVAKGNIHIVEPGLQEVVARCVTQDKTLTAAIAPVAADVFVLTVPTPLREGTRPDIGYLEQAARDIAPMLQPGNLVILESTSPVGTTETIARQLADLRPGLRFPLDGEASPDIHMAYCPERVLPGRILQELVENDRIIGGMTPACTQKAVQLYRHFVKGACRETTAPVAELVKLTENSFRDVNIAFANELSLICDHLQLNVWDVIALANCHPRVNILRPGPGVGGHCIAVDPWFIVDSAPEQARLIRTAREVNDGKAHYVVESIRNTARALGVNRIALLGLAFKPDVDDLRESPALEIAEALAQDGLALLVAEPHIQTLPKSLAAHPNVQLIDAKTATQQADIIVALVAHSSFKSLPAEALAQKQLLDFCGLFQE